MSLRIKEEQITPDIAREMLLRNTKNRSIRQGHVANLVKEITEGRWQLTHQGIAISSDNVLLDGQHRLHAIVASGRSVRIMVAYNADPETYRVLDKGEKRAHFDRLHLVDDVSENRFICTVINSYLRCACNTSGAISVDFIENEFLEHTESWIWCSKVLHVKRRGLAVGNVLGAITSYHMDAPAKAETFATGLFDGLELTSLSPVLTLREALLAGRINTGTSEGYWKTIAACRAHRDGRTLHSIIAATQDFQGHRPTRMVQERRAISAKGTATKRSKQSKRPETVS